MNSKERLKSVLNREIPDRVPMLEISFWEETLERWKGEGLPAEIHYQSPFISGSEYRNKNTFEDYFGLDRIAIFGYDGTMGFEEAILEENDEFRIYSTRDGVTNKAFKNATVPPLQIDRKIKSREDWDGYKSRLQPDENRIDAEITNLCKRLNGQGVFTVIKPEEPCQYALHLMGEEDCLVSMATEPDYIEDFIARYTEFEINMLEILMGKGAQPDALWFFSDLCYKNGMLFSPAFYKERVMKYHKRIFAFCKSRNMHVIYHCDGKVKQLLPLLIESGIDCIQPMEARAGNDVRDYKKLYGDRITFCGNISVETLSGSRMTIEEEIEGKMTEAKQGGGYIFHSDHSVPPSVSLDNYKYALELARKYGSY